MRLLSPKAFSIKITRNCPASTWKGSSAPFEMDVYPPICRDLLTGRVGFAGSNAVPLYGNNLRIHSCADQIVSGRLCSPQGKRCVGLASAGKVVGPYQDNAAGAC